MRNNLLLISFLFFSLLLTAQQNNRKSYYGGVFTPKGDFRALIVPVIFKDAPLSNSKFRNQDHHLEDWSAGKPQLLPDVIDPISGDSPKWLYNRPEHFEQYKDSIFYNDSKMFYHISNGSFRFTADVFKDSLGRPLAVEIDPDGGRDWSHMNKKALDEMKRIHPDFDFSPYDQRKNNPQFVFDNSIQAAPDKIVDYIVFIYRYSPSWSDHPAPGMNRWTGSGGGFASPSGIMLENYNGYKFAQGFTMMWASGVFFHELAHTLYNLPHLWGTNGTVGEYFYRPSVGWGATSSAGLFQIPSAWETWFLGYTTLVADIKTEGDLKAGNTFELRDYTTTADALRVKIPFSGGQNLWLEYHSIEHPFDRHIWSGRKIGKDVISKPAAGVYAYIEHVSDSHEKIPGVLSPVCNALKPINAAGNFDYEYIDEEPKQNAWGNKLYRFRKLKANPVSGTNPFFYFRADFNKDGIISLDKNYNGAKNEGEPIMTEEIYPDSFANLYQCFGVFDSEWNYSRSSAFLPGDEFGLNSNPLLCSYATYNDKTLKMEPVYLTGLKINFSKVSAPGTVRISLSFGETFLRKNARWTGIIRLPDITADPKADLVIETGKELILNKSGTANRHTQNESGDFINPSILTIDSAAVILLKKRAKLIVQDNSILEIMPGATLIMEKRAKIVIGKDAKFIADEKSLKRHKNSTIVFRRKLN